MSECDRGLQVVFGASAVLALMVQLIRTRPPIPVPMGEYSNSSLSVIETTHAPYPPYNIPFTPVLGGTEP